MILKRSYLVKKVLLIICMNFVGGELLLEVSKIENGKETLVKNSLSQIIGSNFTLKCRLSSNSSPDKHHDSLIWKKSAKGLSFKNKSNLRHSFESSYNIDQILNANNKDEAELPLFNFSQTNEGLYTCISLKYNITESISIKINDFEKQLRNILDRKTNSLDNYEKNFHFCNQNDMFVCNMSSICIKKRFVCDGKEDCSDGSDENWKQCGGDPCEGKIPCDDGRCIPTEWCCNIQTDEKCNVKIRPSCCPPLIDAAIIYEEKLKKEAIEKNNMSTRYLFITICLISTFLSLLLLILILSKICTFARKYSRNLQAGRNDRPFGTNRHRPIIIEGMGHRVGRQQPHTPDCQHTECAIRREFLRTYSCSFRPNITSMESSPHHDVLDPLLLNRDSTYGDFVHIIESDRPPSYAEAVKISRPSNCNSDQASNFKELRYNISNTPPPPYVSTETLQETERSLARNVF